MLSAIPPFVPRLTFGDLCPLGRTSIEGCDGRGKSPCCCSELAPFFLDTSFNFCCSKATISLLTVAFLTISPSSLDDEVAKSGYWSSTQKMGAVPTCSPTPPRHSLAIREWIIWKFESLQEISIFKSTFVWKFRLQEHPISRFNRKSAACCLLKPPFCPPFLSFLLLLFPHPPELVSQNSPCLASPGHPGLALVFRYLVHKYFGPFSLLERLAGPSSFISFSP